jgi:O-antigen/teichoic acid export membrane protein
MPQASSGLEGRPARIRPGRMRGLTRFVGIRPLDIATAEGRGDERYRRAVLSSLAGGGARVVALVSSLIAVPIAVGYLGVERYGLYATLTALTAMLAFADFGLGNGLMNLVAGAFGHDDVVSARRFISSALVMLVTLSLVLGVGLAAIYPVLPWADLLNAGSEVARREVGPALAVFVGCFLFGLPLGIVQRVQLGYQEGFHNSAWAAVGSLMGLAALVVAVRLDLGLAGVVGALAGGPVLALALNCAVFFGKRRPQLRPAPSSATWRDAITLARFGSLFFVLQLAVAVAYQSDVVVAAKVVGPDAAATYSIAYRLYFLAPSVVGMFLIPIWPAYAEALARRDLAWVRTTLRRTIVVSLLATTAWSIFLLLFGNEVLRLWVGGAISAPVGLTVGLALWAVISNVFTAIAMLLNAANILRFQVIVATLMALTSITASVVLASRFGVAGVIWGTLLAYVAVSALPTVMYVRWLLRRLTPAVVVEEVAG